MIANAGPDFPAPSPSSPIPRNVRPRIVFVINSIGSGGAERALDTILRTGSDHLAHYEAHLVLLDAEPEMRGMPALNGRHCLDAGGRLTASVVRLRRLLHRLQPDVVVGFLPRANLAVALSGGPWRRILCERMHMRSHLAGRYRGWRLAAINRLMRAAYARATLVLGVSQGVSDDLIATFGAPVDRVFTINNPYDLDLIVSEAAKSPPITLPSAFLVAVGRLVAAKGFADLIDAYALADPALPLLILGQGPERAALTARIQAAGLSARILMPGFLDDPWTVVGRSQALISASYNEGFPNAIAEAMVLGRPVLTTDCPSGPAELLGADAGAAGTVMEAPAGLVVPLGDIAALARGIAMLDDPALRTRLGRAGMIRMRDFRAERIAEQYWQVFDQTARR
ncbi:Glycosyltransferase involved in cell wall bisynthesis [Sphingomonas gellani]|uniref:Glycosyltransferase involved in cell wall bisynthesis n=1 Tax=Sphingomonas gellani TaxID=1166340 RepID=A0A1H8HWU6_9SPHN|nr:glycosyltransferase [Sphingomonas gellani]SEN60683.1 Glycosyltransferase involved in cell wall bisynthesis [Sphingomonas gellani]